MRKAAILSVVEGRLPHPHVFSIPSPLWAQDGHSLHPFPYPLPPPRWAREGDERILESGGGGAAPTLESSLFPAPCRGAGPGVRGHYFYCFILALVGS